jgi:hypothetical protein
MSQAAQGNPFRITYLDRSTGGRECIVVEVDADPADLSGSTPKLSVGAAGASLDLVGEVTLNGGPLVAGISGHVSGGLQSLGGVLDTSSPFSMLSGGHSYTLGPGTLAGQNKYIRSYNGTNILTATGCQFSNGGGLAGSIIGTVVDSITFTKETDGAGGGGDFVHLIWDPELGASGAWVIIFTTNATIGGGVTTAGSS